jgi:hypothetical protein
MSLEFSPPEFAGWPDEALHDVAPLNRSDDPIFIVRPNRDALYGHIPLK